MGSVEFGSTFQMFHNLKNGVSYGTTGETCCTVDLPEASSEVITRLLATIVHLPLLFDRHRRVRSARRRQHRLVLLGFLWSMPRFVTVGRD
jgi:hypothetical protein